MSQRLLALLPRCSSHCRPRYGSEGRTGLHLKVSFVLIRSAHPCMRPAVFIPWFLSLTGRLGSMRHPPAQPQRLHPSQPLARQKWYVVIKTKMKLRDRSLVPPSNFFTPGARPVTAAAAAPRSQATSAMPPLSISMRTTRTPHASSPPGHCGPVAEFA